MKKYYECFYLKIEKYDFILYTCIKTNHIKVKTYQIRLFLSKNQINQLQELSDIRKDIWNKLIDIQNNKYEKDKNIFTKFDLNNMLPKLKEEYVDWKKLNSKAIQTIATELYGSYRSFFDLIKKVLISSEYHFLIFVLRISIIVSTKLLIP